MHRVLLLRNKRRTSLLPRFNGVYGSIVAVAFANCYSLPAGAQATTQLQPLVNDTVAQLKLTYRHDTPEQRRRYNEIGKAIEKWRAADRMPENDQRLEEWLRGAIRSSMPGSNKPLPPLPTFADRPAPPPAATAPRAISVDRKPIPPQSTGELPEPPLTQPQSQSLRSDLPIGQPLPFEDPNQSVTVEKPIVPTAAMPPGEDATTSQEPTPEVPAAANPAANGELFVEPVETDQLPAEPELDDELPEAPPLDEDADILKALSDPFVDDPESL